MNFLFLSPHFPTNFQIFVERLHERGISVFGMGDTPHQQLSEPLKSCLSGYAHVGNMEDYEQVYRATAWLISLHGRFVRVASHNEHWLATESRLREDFHIPGMLPSEIERCQRKSLMKEVYRKAGLLTARGKRVRSLEEAKAFAVEVGYPSIIKPDIGVGGDGVVKFHSEQQLNEYFQRANLDDLFMEEFINGTLETFDGLTDQDGRIVHCTSHISPTGVFEVIKDNMDLYYYGLRDLAPDLEKAGRTSVEAFGIKETFFHLEFLRRISDKKLIAMELNKRPPGGFSMDMMNFAADIDLYAEYANIVKENRFSANVKRSYFCAHIARKWGKNYRYSHEDIMDRYGDKMAKAEEISEVFSAVMGNYAYLVRSPEESEILEMIRIIQEKA